MKNPYNFSAFDNTGESGQEFHKNVHTLFDCMGQLLASNSDKIKSNQVNKCKQYFIQI